MVPAAPQPQLASPPPLPTSLPAAPETNQAEANPFADMAQDSEVKSPAETSQPNPFADDAGLTQPATAPTVNREPETASSSSKAAVMEMVGGLETEMERMDIAKSPTVPTKPPSVPFLSPVR